MYAEFFGLRELPFNNTPDPRFFYSTPDHEEAMASLIYAVKERKGFVLLTGEVGAGKTLVSRLMIKHFGGTIAFANINHAIRDSGDLIESLCAEFELAHDKQASNAYLVRTLHDFLLAKFAQNTPVVLVLDEAQNFPVEAFEQLRMIGNLEADDAKLLQIVIVGQPELQTMFQSNALRQLRQRLFRSFHLPALSRSAAEGYIRHRLQVAGATDPSMFGPRSIDAIQRASRGLPRLINTLCDNILLSAYSADRRSFDASFVEHVLATLAPPDATLALASDPPNSANDRVHPTYHAPPDLSRHQEKTAVASIEALRLLEQMQSRMHQAAALGDRLAASAQKADQSHQLLVQREKQVGHLLHNMKISAAGLAPLLDQLNSATRKSIHSTRSAEAVSLRLVEQSAKSQLILDRVAEIMPALRLASLKSSINTMPSHIEDAKCEVVAGKTESFPARNGTIKPLKQKVAQWIELQPIPLFEPASNSGRPALRLAEHMEHLAAVVHQAVHACTAPGKVSAL